MSEQHNSGARVPRAIDTAFELGDALGEVGDRLRQFPGVALRLAGDAFYLTGIKKRMPKQPQ